MASEKRKLTLSKETLRTLSATALSQVAGGSGYPSQYCQPTANGCGTDWTWQQTICPPNNSQGCGTSTCGQLYGCDTSVCTQTYCTGATNTCNGSWCIC